MSIVRPANDALIHILGRIRTNLGTNKAVVVIPNAKGDLSVVRQVSIGSLDQLLISSHLVVSEAVVQTTIAYLQAEDELPVVYREHLDDNTYEWVLWDVVENKPRLINGDKVVAEYKDVL